MAAGSRGRAKALMPLIAASALFFLQAAHLTTAAEFNFEISRRVHEKLSQYMLGAIPVIEIGRASV